MTPKPTTSCNKETARYY